MFEGFFNRRIPQKHLQVDSLYLDDTNSRRWLDVMIRKLRCQFVELQSLRRTLSLAVVQ